MPFSQEYYFLPFMDATAHIKRMSKFEIKIKGLSKYLVSSYTLRCSAFCNECRNYILIYTYPSTMWKMHTKDWYLEK